MRFMKASVALAAAAALTLSACSGSGAKGGDATSKTGSATSLPASDYNKVDPAELADGGTLRLAISSYPEQWNATHVDGNTVDLSTKIYGFLAPINWVFDEKGNFDVNKNYVESFEANTDGDGTNAMVITLNLNPKSHWNDGTPITAADYQATWKACSGQVGGISCPSTDGWTQISAIEEGTSPQQVVVKYSEKYPDWSANLSRVYPAAGVSDAEAFNKGWLDPVEANKFFAGPFKVAGSNVAQGVLTLERNPEWWGTPAKLDTVTFSALDQKATAAGYANGEIDAIDFIVDAATYETAKGRPDGKITMSDSVQWRHFTFNARAGALQDKLVRQAIQLGIDTKDIAASDLSGLPSQDFDLNLGNHFFMPNQKGYKDNSTKWAYDPEAAKAKLEEAGYKMNETTKFYEKDGQELSFRYLRIPGNAANENEGAMLMEMMAEIGVKVTYQDVESKDFFNNVIGGEYDVTSFAWNGTPYPMANVGQIYGNPFDAEGQLANSNFTGMKVDKVDELIPAIAKETDDTKRRELTNQVDEVIWEEVMTLPLYYRANITAIPAKLANYGSTVFETLLPENIGYVK
ncbi:ABC transporter family substrate-binding protein [Trueperella pecoris]|uniref:ABC transporter family substrate-binding protein n=1 Tax=Trueperella pecoris TaxID=2733571 RepID=A0A7M1QZ29_9ACTO|nr:ABC transporter family substrate-binding protein [Trueperella pecoris]QOR47280.1 ABC transporter family substrate-binding protein [Trueperella pecoris]